MTAFRRRLLLNVALAGFLGPGFLRKAEAVEYNYDASGRLTGVAYEDGSTVTYTYDDAGNRTQVVRAGPAAPTGALTATPAAIGPGGSSTLSWTSANATSASINNGIGTVTPVSGGSIQVSPSASTTYMLTLNGPGGQITKQAMITVGLDQTPDPRNWPDLYPSWNGTPTGSPFPDWFDSPVHTIAGLAAGVSITLSFSQDNVDADAAGLQVQVFKNGAYATRSLSVPDAMGVSAGPVGPTVSVANGDTIRFRALVFDSAIPVGSGLSSGRSARQVVTNQTTGAVFDTFIVGGWYSEQDGSCPPLQICSP